MTPSAMLARAVRSMVGDRSLDLARAVRSRVRWPPVSRERLVAASSIDELHALAHERPLEGFNGQILRLKYLVHLAEAVRCTSFVETGTFLGWTATAARHFLRLPVFTVEVTPTVTQARIRARLLGVTGIEFQHGDSRRVLREWLDGRRPGATPMLYLDAHWAGQHPLREEVEIAAERGRCVVVIDDFRVPYDDGFGYDADEASVIDLASVADVLPCARTRILMPRHRSADETGSRRGTMIALIDLPDPRDRLPPLARSLFDLHAGIMSPRS